MYFPELGWGKSFNQFSEDILLVLTPAMPRLVNYRLHSGFCPGMLKEENRKKYAKSRLGAKEYRFT